MGKKSYNGPSHVQQILITLAALVIVVAGMRASADILMPFLLALFIVFQPFHPFAVYLNLVIDYCRPFQSVHYSIDRRHGTGSFAYLPLSKGIVSVSSFFSPVGCTSAYNCLHL